MLFLLLSISCSLTTASVIKIAGVRSLHVPSLLTANYAAATLVSVLLLLPTGQFSVRWSAGLIILGMVAGVIFIAGFFALAAATRLAGMSLSVGIMRVSVLIPVLASWLIWHEIPTALQTVGLVLAALSFFGLAHRGSRPGREPAVSGAASALTLAFLMSGLADLSLKLFSEAYGETVPTASFMVIVFGVAGVLGLGWVALSRDEIARPVLWRSWAWGVLLGIANLGSVAFMLQAVGRLPGPVVFPLNNAGIMLGATLLGVALWRERLTRLNRAGLALALAAIVLLGL